MDLVENKDKNEVTATFELPGLKKEDVRIDVQQNRVTISGEVKTSEERQEGDYAVRERGYGSFSRTLQLPQGTEVSPAVTLPSWIEAHVSYSSVTSRQRWRMES